MPYYPNYNPYSNPDQQIQFQQWQLQQQMQYTNISQQQSDQQSHQPQDEVDETVPTLSSKKNVTRGKRIKKMAKRNVEPEPQAEAVKVRIVGARTRVAFNGEKYVSYLYSRDPKNLLAQVENPDSTNARRFCQWVIEEEPEVFGDDALPRPPSVQKIAKSQRSSNLTASSGSNLGMFQEMLQQQYELDRKEKTECIDREVNSRVTLYDSQKVAEDLKVLQMSTDGMDPVDAAIINAQKARIRALYQPNH
ncbi:hypothetical protein Tco_1131650 [Tanacetum coccineum]